ncbi:apolipoprotein D and lipocalin family protein [Povalibacter uvarum]|uniref:Outer membrane lipoprotein Blc n=1 Tax=Povalibacter uvarum TaxID=732238 RepID=A0A841HJK4_9GAMM|nr:lipocalin family protein [Povalibacter uvarum]MBB6092398.1 apolipoprotein D and lipocalin family protein [Povalibacter uvarum]
MKSTTLVLVAAMFLSACANSPPSQPLRTVKQVDLARYMGDWYVIANIPYFAERNCFDSVESYALRPDGRIDNWFSCRRGSPDAPFERKVSALAKVEDATTNARWSVRFFGLISVQYLVIDLDEQYRWAVIGHPSRNYGWVLARDKMLPDATYDQILRRLGEQGYEVSRFAKVPQRT